MTQISNSRLRYLGLLGRVNTERAKADREKMGRGERVNRDGKKNPNDKVSRRRDEVSRKSRFLADKLWTRCSSAPTQSGRVSRIMAPLLGKVKCASCARLTQKGVWSLSGGRTRFAVCSQNWTETSTEGEKREEWINAQPVFAKSPVASNQHFFFFCCCYMLEPTALSNNQSILFFFK